MSFSIGEKSNSQIRGQKDIRQALNIGNDVRGFFFENKEAKTVQRFLYLTQAPFFHIELCV